MFWDLKDTKYDYMKNLFCKKKNIILLLLAVQVHCWKLIEEAFEFNCTAVRLLSNYILLHLALEKYNKLIHS